MRLSRLKIVVLPAPLGPMIVSTWPGSTAKLTPASALIPPKLMARSSTANRLKCQPRGAPRLRRGASERWGSGGHFGAPSKNDVSSQPLRAHVGLLAPEGGVLVEGKQREVDLDLHPASVDAEWLEEDEEHQDEAEEAGLEAGLLHEAVEPLPRRHRVARLRDEHGQDRDEHCAVHGAVQAAEPADHDHQEQLDGQEHAEDVRGEKADLVREQRAREAHEGGGIGERHRLVERQVDAHRLRGDLAVADGDPRASRRRLQEVGGQPQRADQEGQAEEVEGDVVREGDAEQDWLVDGLALQTAGDPVPARNTSWMM